MGKGDRDPAQINTCVCGREREECGGIKSVIGSHRVPSTYGAAYMSLPPELPLFLRPLKSVLTVKELIIKYN